MKNFMSKDLRKAKRRMNRIQKRMETVPVTKIYGKAELRKIKQSRDEKPWYGKVPNDAVVDDPPIRIIIAARYIPDGATVSHPMGHQTYTIKKVITIIPLIEAEDGETYTQGAPQQIEAKGSRFLTASHSSAYNIVAEDSLLCWRPDSSREVREYFEAIEMGVPK